MGCSRSRPPTARRNSRRTGRTRYPSSGAHQARGRRADRARRSRSLSAALEDGDRKSRPRRGSGKRSPRGHLPALRPPVPRNRNAATVRGLDGTRSPRMETGTTSPLAADRAHHRPGAQRSCRESQRRGRTVHIYGVAKTIAVGTMRAGAFGHAGASSDDDGTNPSARLLSHCPRSCASPAFGRLVIFLPPREHAPPHVHVRHAHGEVVIELGSRQQRGTIRSVCGMSDHDVRRAVAIVESHLEHLHDCWSQHHGPSHHPSSDDR